MERHPLTAVVAGLVAVTLFVSCDASGARTGVMRGNARFRRGEYGAAIALYLQAAERIPAGRSSPQYRRVLYDLASCYAALGEGQAALETLGELQSREDRELEFRRSFNLGCLAYDAGRYSAAVERFTSALQVRPSDWDAKRNLELALLRSRMPPAVEPAGPSGMDEDAAEQAIRLLEYVQERERGIWESSRVQPSAPQPEDW